MLVVGEWPLSCCVLDLVLTWFECISMLVILLNCVTLGMYQPCDDMDCLSERCKILQVRPAAPPHPAPQAPPILARPRPSQPPLHSWSCPRCAHPLCLTASWSYLRPFHPLSLPSSPLCLEASALVHALPFLPSPTSSWSPHPQPAIQ